MNTASPIYDLVSIWRVCRAPGPLEITAARARLFTAAVHEITAKAADGIKYDPMRDVRFRWASQWLDLHERSIPAIDEDTEFACGMVMNERPPMSHKHLQAHDAA